MKLWIIIMKLERHHHLCLKLKNKTEPCPNHMIDQPLMITTIWNKLSTSWLYTLMRKKHIFKQQSLYVAASDTSTKIKIVVASSTSTVVKIKRSCWRNSINWSKNSRCQKSINWSKKSCCQRIIIWERKARFEIYGHMYGIHKDARYSFLTIIVDKNPAPGYEHWESWDCWLWNIVRTIFALQGPISWFSQIEAQIAWTCTKVMASVLQRYRRMMKPAMIFINVLYDCVLFNKTNLWSFFIFCWWKIEHFHPWTPNKNRYCRCFFHVW